jgi:hypothetical protein
MGIHALVQYQPSSYFPVAFPLPFQSISILPTRVQVPSVFLLISKPHQRLQGPVAVPVLPNLPDKKHHTDPQLHPFTQPFHLLASSGLTPNDHHIGIGGWLARSLADWSSSGWWTIRSVNEDSAADTSIERMRKPLTPMGQGFTFGSKPPLSSTGGMG